MGLLSRGDHVVVPSMEHNSVMRPLNYLFRRGIIEMSIVPCSKEGHIDLKGLKRQIKKNTRLLAVTHASNVVGTIAPLEEIGRISGERLRLSEPQRERLSQGESSMRSHFCNVRISERQNHFWE